MSFKVQHVATVGGNLCLALPAGAMISLTAALGATVVIWTPDGGERREPVADFVRGAGVTSLAPGEIVRAVDVPASALAAPDGVPPDVADQARPGRRRSSIGCRLDGAPSPRPPPARWCSTRADLEAGLAAVDCWYDDPHGPADWRAHVTAVLVAEVAGELAA